MFGIGTTEILLILAVALIVLGPKSLPKIARTLGKGLAEFRKVSTDFQRTLNTEIELEEREKRKQAAEERLQAKGSATAEPAASSPAAAPAEEPTGELATAPDASGQKDIDVPSAATAASASEDEATAKTASDAAGEKA